MLRTATVVATLCLALAACGDEDEPAPAHDGYPAGVEDAFMASCERTSDGKVEICRCAFDRIEASVPYEEFEQADAAIRRGEDARPSTERKLRDALQSCS